MRLDHVAAIALLAALTLASPGTEAEPGERREAQLAAANEARKAVDEQLETRRRRARVLLRRLHRGLRDRRARALVEPDDRWRRSRHLSDLRRILVAELAELEALSAEQGALETVRRQLEGEPSALPAIEALLRPVPGAKLEESAGDHRILLVRPGDPVRAPMAGRVAYVGPVRGLGPSAIIEGGGRWLVLGPMETAATRGADVARGDPLGAAAGDRLRLELRREDGRGGTPLDPGILPD
jgi:septal ring factor EnvC (AmiA/AmiB activator)